MRLGYALLVGALLALACVIPGGRTALADEHEPSSKEEEQARKDKERMRAWRLLMRTAALHQQGKYAEAIPVAKEALAASEGLGDSTQGFLPASLNARFTSEAQRGDLEGDTASGLKVEA